MQYFSVELLAFAAVLFTAASYRCVYRLSTIRLNRVGEEPAIRWTDMDKFFCVMAAFDGILLGGLSVHFGTTFGAILWMVVGALLTGAVIGRMLAVSHLNKYRQAVSVANEKRKMQIREAETFFSSKSDTDLSVIEAAGRAASIARNIAVDNATKWLRK
ncbi:MAG: hypothetical protein P4L53_23165 [Candidatus Obscuribacterales bacterium]|nr:hypothetical protein [Candidatus Obscuribacterales bacterium]